LSENTGVLRLGESLVGVNNFYPPKEINIGSVSRDERDITVTHIREEQERMESIAWEAAGKL